MAALRPARSIAGNGLTLALLVLREAWDRFDLLTLRAKCSLVVFGAVMHLAVLAQLVLVSWMLATVVGLLRPM